VISVAGPLQSNTARCQQEPVGPCAPLRSGFVHRFTRRTLFLPNSLRGVTTVSMAVVVFLNLAGRLGISAWVVRPKPYRFAMWGCAGCRRPMRACLDCNTPTLIRHSMLGSAFTKHNK